MKLHNFKFILAALALGCLVACNGENKSANATETVDSAATVASGDDGMDPTYEEPARPDPKPADEIKAMGKLHEDAAKAERKFLGNKELENAMSKLKETTDADGMPVMGAIDDAKFAAFTTKELLCYTIFHPESWDQNCAEFLFDAGSVKGFSAYLPFSGDSPSERQANAMEAKLKEVSPLIVESIRSTKMVSLQMMHAVSQYDVREAIVPMIEIYQSQKPKDDLILTTFMEMMAMKDYPDWKSSDIFSQFGEGMREWIPMTPENEAAIIALARGYAASK